MSELLLLRTLYLLKLPNGRQIDGRSLQLNVCRRNGNCRE